MSDYRNPPYVKPASTSRAASPTGSIRSNASKSTTRSRLKGALHKVSKVARSNFITEGLRRKASIDSWGEEIPTSQETQDGMPLTGPSVENDLEAAARAYMAAGAAQGNDADDDDDDDDDNHSVSASVKDALDAHAEEEAYMASHEPLTLVVPTPAGEGTPPNVPGSLPDPNLTPRSPRVAQATEAELYKLRQTAILEDRDRDHDIFSAESIPTPQFQTQIDQSKEIVGEIVDEEIRASSPMLPDEIVTFGPAEVKAVREAFQTVSRMFGSISPNMATNPELLVEVAKSFFGRFVSTEWADVKDHGSSIKDLFRTYHKYEKRVRIEVPDDETNASAPGAAPGPPPPPPTAGLPAVPNPAAMEVDPSPPRIPAALKGKGKAVPTPAPAKEAEPIKPASPIKVSAVPRPLPTNPGPSKATGKGNCNPAWVAKLNGKNVYEAHFDSVTQAALLEDKSQSRDTQSAPRAPQAAAPQRDNSSARISRDNSSSKAKPPPPPVPMDSRPAAHAAFMARAQNTAQGRASRDKPKRMSYAQTAAIQKNAAVIPALSAESIQWAKELRASFPEISVREALEYTLLPQQSASPPTAPQSKRKTAVAERQQGISNGLNRKSAQFAFSHLIQPEQFSDMGRIVNEMNRHLTATSPVMRVQNGRLFKSVVHFYLNVAPTRAQFDRLKECLFKVLQKEAPTQGSDDPFAPQSIAHLIMKGFDYYTNVYNRRPEDILTGEQIMERMQGVDQFRGLECVRPPAVVRSKGSNDMAIAFVDVWDSKNGIRTKELVNKVYHIGGKLIKLEYARQREFVPQCQNCWSWTHGTSRCRINHQRCARCGQPHKTENHDLFATCCGAVKKTADYTGVCAHPLKCINCKGSHLASDSKCVYKRHQNNVAWHNQRREADYKALREKRERQKTNITQSLQPEAEIIEITSSSE
jgi:hypothetical protein